MLRRAAQEGEAPTDASGHDSTRLGLRPCSNTLKTHCSPLAALGTDIWLVLKSTRSSLSEAARTHSAPELTSELPITGEAGLMG